MAAYTKQRAAETATAEVDPRRTRFAVRRTGAVAMTPWRILQRMMAVLALGLCISDIRGDTLQSAGEALYRRGLLGSGAPLEGARRDSGQSLQGEAAACVHCHRNSGLGAQEGRYYIPPVSTRYLYGDPASAIEYQSLPNAPSAPPHRAPYNDVLLARAIREGIDSTGHALDYLMPRYALNDDDMAALIAYLKTLAPEHVPGATPTLLHFATIITPDADPVKKGAMLDVLNRYFDEKNRLPFKPRPPLHSSDKTAGDKVMLLANRHWRLHVWELAGPPSDWGAQLQHYFSAEPVMAVISGLGRSNWSPVHKFCQQAHLPCLFPNIEVPVDITQDFYSVYFSKGVLLESELMASRIAGTGAAEVTALAPDPVQQVYRADDSGAAGAAALAKTLRAFGRTTEDFVIPSAAPMPAVREAIQRAAGQGTLVLWLRPEDLTALAGLKAPERPIFASGLLAGLERAPLPADWRYHILMTYPFDLPDKRIVRVDYALGWFRFQKIPVVAEQVQLDTYLACGLLAEALSHMGDNVVPEYLIERMEDMITIRYLTGYYPRLSLAQGQRFASKGGYLVELSPSAHGGLVPSGDWTVP